MAEPAVIYTKDGGIATVTINRPEKLNAVNGEVLCRLTDAWNDINNDPAVRAAILTGAGDKAFCAGADLDRLVSMFQGKRPPEDEFDHRIKADMSITQTGFMRGLDVYKPIIAAVKGLCIAGGTEILQATDIRVAAQDAEFAIAEVKWGLFPIAGSTVRLARQIPFCKAMEILLTGERFSAAEALRIGLINKVVPAADVMKEARRYAEIICANGPLAVQAVKRSVLASLGVPTEQALQKEMELGLPVHASKDAKEGTSAFKEKRKPLFKGE